ncbi:MAG TPA: ribosomal protein L15 family protein, partial [Bryobacterales bacterium]|nr:ribosomal protein L15 family protein [Bryobacterales bacterium]
KAKVNLKVAHASASAREAIEKAGGSVEMTYVRKKAAKDEA